MTQRSGSMELPPEHPQRLSALYQYHNAPEVAPAHGLEYDDSNYPHSDKYPVIHSMPALTSGWKNKGFTDDNRPPRIIFGMKVRTFLVVATIMIMVIVGAAVGGAVGGSTIKNGSSTWVPTNATTASTSSASSTPTLTASSYSAATPTYAPIVDCPAANNTLYTSSFSSGFAGTVQSGSKLNYTRYCDVASPLTTSTTLLSTFAYSFEDCIEACAALNFYNNNGNCQTAVFQANGTRPVNCWAGTVNTTLSSLTAQTSSDIALLHS